MQRHNGSPIAATMSLRGSSIFRQFVSFVGVGAVATAAHYVILIVLVQFYHLNPTLASSIGAVAGALISYVLNYHYTFRSNSGHAVSMVKFFAVAGVGLVLNSMSMLICIEVFGFYYLLSQVLATALVLIWSFSANRAWTFRESHR